MSLPPMSDVSSREDMGLGPLDVTSTELAEILSITPKTVATWARNGLVTPKGKISLGRGHPTRVFTLDDVLGEFMGHLAAVESGEANRWDDLPIYVDILRREVDKRIAAWARDAEPPSEETDPEAALPRALVEHLRSDLDEAWARLAAAESALAKVVLEDAPLFTFSEVAAMHNAVDAYRHCQAEKARG